MNVNLKETIAQIYARKGTREAPARWRTAGNNFVVKQDDVFPAIHRSIAGTLPLCHIHDETFLNLGHCMD